MGIENHFDVLDLFNYVIIDNLGQEPVSTYKAINPNSGEKYLIRLADSSIHNSLNFERPKREDEIWNKFRFDFMVPTEKYDWEVGPDGSLYSFSVKPYYEGMPLEEKIMHSPMIANQLRRYVDILHNDAELVGIDYSANNFIMHKGKLKMRNYGSLIGNDCMMGSVLAAINDISFFEGGDELNLF